jgi:hypothetical protein
LKAFFIRVFKKLGIAVTPNVLAFLEVKDKKRAKRLVKIATKDSKRHRNTKKFDKLKEDTAIAIKEKARWSCTYKSGQNMKDVEEEGMQPPPKKKPKQQRIVHVCSHPFCLLKGHKTTSSKKCRANPERIARDGLEELCALAVAAAAVAAGNALIATGDGRQALEQAEADDVAALDSLPFDSATSDDDNADVGILVSTI